ncbi:hypothetical protein ES332_A07G264000v1 [Gossypium tomentosum]|uniref:Peroxidase n=1 Tax=Gossypium tomentosum TaxID=34277 RepID=A0A5D2PZX1_GOSTO|nr:hypothetical protein ES332_A07G264000v1 [Gossypium tomentosum]
MSWFQMITTLFVVAMTVGASNAQLSATFYAKTCPNVSTIVRNVLQQAQQNDIWIFPKLIRLHFHDCFVHGCDASLLLNGTDSEKTATPNLSTDGYAVIDDIKTALEKACPCVVSCADILALAAQISVSLGGGPRWKVPLGRRDSRTTHREGTGTIPTGHESLANIATLFRSMGFDSTDLVALSEFNTLNKQILNQTQAHGIYSDKQTFNEFFFSHEMSVGYQAFTHLEGHDAKLTRPSTRLTRTHLNNYVPKADNVTSLIDLDEQTSLTFDNNYFLNLQNRRGLLQTDQELFSTNGAETVAIVNRFARSQSQFFSRFAKAMIKMGNINPLIGTNGEIRLDCKKTN